MSKRNIALLVILTLLLAFAVFYFSRLKAPPAELTEKQKIDILKKLNAGQTALPSDAEKKQLLKELNSETENKPLTDEERAALLNAL